MEDKSVFEKNAALLGNDASHDHAIQTEIRRKKQMEPLHLADIGSFFAGGIIESVKGNDGITDEATISNGSVYVRYMIPEADHPKTPVVFIHGGGLTGVCYETTPDGGEGWDTLFVRSGHPVYNVDQVDRGRSSNSATAAKLNGIRSGEGNEVLPIRVSGRESAELMNRGSVQFPAEAMDQYLCQMTGDYKIIQGLVKGFAYGFEERNIPAIVQLLKKIGPAILIAHSQAGPIAWQAAADAPEFVKGLIQIEPMTGAQGFEKTPETLPILAVYADNVPVYMEAGMNDFRKLGEETERPVEVLHLPEAGIYGNGHMMMLERNNDVIAERIISWIDKLEA